MLDSLVVQHLLAHTKATRFHGMIYFPPDASPPSGAMAVQDGPTSIRVTWTPPSPLGDTTGYRISYTGGGGSSDSVDVDDGNTNSHTLMGLTNGETYTISIVGTSSPGFPSTPVETGTVTLSKTNILIVYIVEPTQGNRKRGL